MNREIIATILGVASLSLVKKIGSSSNLRSFLGNPELIEGVIRGHFYPCPHMIGETYDSVADMDLDWELEGDSDDLMKLSRALQNDIEINPNNTNYTVFNNFLNNNSANNVSQYLIENIQNMNLLDRHDLIKRYTSLLYNLQSITLDFPEDMIDIEDGVLSVVCNIHCTFKFTNTESEIIDMMEDIIDILGQNNYFEDFLSSYEQVDPQNKLTEKIKKYVFGNTSSELRRF